MNALPTLEIGLFGFLALGGLFPLRGTRRRSYHLRNSTALAAFFILGPSAFALVLSAALVSALAPFYIVHDGQGWASGLRVCRVGERRTEIGFLFRDTAHLILALGVAHAVYQLLGGRGYPLPLGSVSDVLRFFSASSAAATLIGAANEAHAYFRRRGAGTTRMSTDARGAFSWDAPFYGFLFVAGSPLQFLAHLAYLSYGAVPMLIVAGWFFLLSLFHSSLLHQRRQMRALFHDLEVRQRLAALGEVTARIVHQTRHQSGLIGISAHLIRQALESSPQIDVAKIQKELDRLESVVEALRGMLNRDLTRTGMAPSSAPDVPLSFEALVCAEVEKLQKKAEQRGVTLILLGDDGPIPPRPPNDVYKLSEGVFNILDNAIWAAESAVWVEMRWKEGWFAITVSDDGSGMPADLLAKAADPFVTTKPEGIGMGLSLAQSAARLWDGELILENRPEGGLAATIRFPVGIRSPSELTSSA